MKEVLSFESRNVRPRSAVLCGVRDHGKADCNQRNSGGARLLPNGPFRYAGRDLHVFAAVSRVVRQPAAPWGRQRHNNG